MNLGQLLETQVERFKLKLDKKFTKPSTSCPKLDSVHSLAKKKGYLIAWIIERFFFFQKFIKGKAFSDEKRDHYKKYVQAYQDTGSSKHSEGSRS